MSCRTGPLRWAGVRTLFNLSGQIERRRPAVRDQYPPTIGRAEEKDPFTTGRHATKWPPQPHGPSAGRAFNTSPNVSVWYCSIFTDDRDEYPWDFESLFLPWGLILRDWRSSHFIRRRARHLVAVHQSCFLGRDRLHRLLFAEALPDIVVARQSLKGFSRPKAHLPLERHFLSNRRRETTKNAATATWTYGQLHPARAALQQLIASRAHNTRSVLPSRRLRPSFRRCRCRPARPRANRLRKTSTTILSLAGCSPTPSG